MRRTISRPDSDWDILILVNKPKVSLKDEQAFRGNLYELEQKIGQPINDKLSIIAYIKIFNGKAYRYEKDYYLFSKYSRGIPDCE